MKTALRTPRYLLLVLLLSGCGPDGGAAPEGRLHGACRADGTCDVGLVCSDGTCVLDYLNMDGGPGQDGAAIPDGARGWPARPDLRPAADSTAPTPPAPWAATIAGPFPVLRGAGVAARGNEVLLVGQGVPAGKMATDLVLVKMQTSGAILWQKIIDTGGGDYGGDVAPVGSGGYLIAGQSNAKIWLVRIDGNGQVLWQRTYADAGKDATSASRVLATSDGGFLVVGNSYTWSEVSEENMLVFKVDATGTLLWHRRLEGPGGLLVRGAALLKSGGAAVVGTHDQGSDKAVFVVRLTASGAIEWAKRLGGPDWDLGVDVAETPGQELVVLGSTRSFGAGQNDLWLLRLSGAGDLVSQSVLGGPGNDTGERLYPVGSELLVSGETTSGGAMSVDLFAARLSAKGKPAWQVRLGEAGWDYGAGSALVPGGGAFLFADTDVGEGQFHWIAGVIDGNGSVPPGCALAAATSMTVGTSTAQVTSLLLKEVAAAVSHSDVTAPPTSLSVQLSPRCP